MALGRACAGWIQRAFFCTPSNVSAGVATAQEAYEHALECGPVCGRELFHSRRSTHQFRSRSETRFNFFGARASSTFRRAAAICSLPVRCERLPSHTARYSGQRCLATLSCAGPRGIQLSKGQGEPATSTKVVTKPKLEVKHENGPVKLCVHE